MTADLKDKIAVVGIGNTEYGRRLGRDAYSLAAEAFRNALDDCGLKKEQIDGYQVDGSIDYDKTARVLGLDVQFSHQKWWHGRLIGNLLMDSALVLNAGIVDYIAIIVATDGGSRKWKIGGDEEKKFIPTEGSREGGGPHGEDPVWGITGPVGLFAMHAQRYFHLYGATSRDLGEIALAQRQWATLNPNAVMKKPMTIEDHQQSRFIMEPLRLLDCCITTDGGGCLILTTAERARGLKKSPVYLSGFSPVGVTQANYFEDMIGAEGKGKLNARDKIAFKNVEMAYKMASLSPKDIDALYCYDAFSSDVLFSLELAGFCPAGEAARFVKGGRTGPGGDFPVNPSGGLLSEAHCLAWNHMVDIIRQLRGECGARQIKNANVISFLGRNGDMFIFRR